MSNNFVQSDMGFPDVDYEWGQEDNYQGFVNTNVEEKMREEYYSNADAEFCLNASDTITVEDAGGPIKTLPISQGLSEGHIDCNNLCEDARPTFGFKKNCKAKIFDKKKTGDWITNFLAGTGLYRPIPTYNPNAPTSSQPGYGGGILYGCTNPNSLNYNPMANADDGSCQASGGLSPLAWAGIGVGAILLIIGIVAISSSGGGGSSTRKSTTRRRRNKTYKRSPAKNKVVVNLED